MPRISSLLPLALPALFLAGCPDPKGSYDEFKDRYNAINPSSGGAAGAAGAGGSDAGACVVPAPGELDGDYIFALSAKLKPVAPLIFLVKVTSKDASGSTAMDWSLQPLNRFDRETPVGDPIVLSGIVIDANGKIDANSLVNTPISVTGEANPISGSNITAEVQSLTGGNFCNTDGFYCGGVVGNVTKPIPIELAGSTWTLTKVTGPADYPDPVPINCKKDPADPPPPPP